MGVVLASAGPMLGAFQIVQLSATWGHSGSEVTVQVDASYMIGGSEHSQLFLIPHAAYETSPEPDRCDQIPGAIIVGALDWRAATVEFRGETYSGFVGEGSFTVPTVENAGVYSLAGIEDDPYTGCHEFSIFGVGFELPDSATAAPGHWGPPSIGGLVLLGASVLLCVSSVIWRFRNRDQRPGTEANAASIEPYGADAYGS
jgi:hypothetical protein